MTRSAVLGGAAAVLLALSACGNDTDGEGAPGVDDPEQEEPAEEAEEAPEDAAEEADGDGPITVEAGEMYFDGLPASIEAGTVEFELDNVGSMQHDLVIEELGDEVVVLAEPGEAATGTVELEPGEYTIYCSIGTHRGQGMEETITVE